MEVAYLKSYILENNFIPVILENLQCHHIVYKHEYYQCGNPDGDNKTAIVVYANENLTTIDYTRNISHVNKDSTDLFDLVQFFLNKNFFQTIKTVCEWIGLDYYHNTEEAVPDSIKMTQLIMAMCAGADFNCVDRPIKPIPECILSYYKPYVNDLFFKDHIGYETQKLFEVGYDDISNYITIPIRDELGNLVGVKGRVFSTAKDIENKYIYLEPCSKSRILYGFHLTSGYIKQANCVFIVESEKAVMQLWEYGYKNVVSTGGSKISSIQIQKLTRLCKTIIFCYDKDITLEALQDITSRFIDGMEIYALIDSKDILSEKESPTDNPVKFEELLNQHKQQLK